PATLVYTTNGNLGTFSNNSSAVAYEWDAANRLIAINAATHRSEFYYNGLGHRVRIVEKDNGIITSEKRFVWCGGRICEERDSSDVVVRRFYKRGKQENGSNLFYSLDHLKSIREISFGTGAVSARYDYAPYGRATALVGTLDDELT